MKIRKLREKIIKKIEEGEVIERNERVIKEIVEKEIEEGEKRIEVVKEGGGKKMMRVKDNG